MSQQAAESKMAFIKPSVRAMYQIKPKLCIMYVNSPAQMRPQAVNKLYSFDGDNCGEAKAFGFISD